GEVTIATGETSAPLTIELPQGVLGTLPSETLGFEISTPGSTPVFSATAETIIVNNQPEPGLAPVPVLGDASTVGRLTRNGDAYSLDLGKVIQGVGLTIPLDVLNAASAGADELSGSVAATSGGGFTLLSGSTIAPIAPGANNQSIHLSVGTGNTGSNSETFTF